MGLPSCMPSIFDQNIVMWHKTVFNIARYLTQNVPHLNQTISTWCHCSAHSFTILKVTCILPLFCTASNHMQENILLSMNKKLRFNYIFPHTKSYISILICQTNDMHIHWIQKNDEIVEAYWMNWEVSHSTISVILCSFMFFRK